MKRSLGQPVFFSSTGQADGSFGKLVTSQTEGGQPPEVFDFIKPKRKVTKVFIHCSANSNPKWGITELGILHKNDIEYHYFIDRDGVIHNTRSLERHPKAAQENNNTNSIAICLHGGKKYADFKPIQYEQLKILCNAINVAYKDIPFRGHIEVSNKGKTCPNFDYKGVLGINNEGRLIG